MKLLNILILIFTCSALLGQDASETQIKVLSFNILHGATTQGDFDLDVIADVIKRTNPDLVALQEVDRFTNRAKKYDLVTELAIRTDMSPLFGRAMPYDGGEYGEGILSKWSFISSRNVPLPYSSGNEPRAALEVTLRTGNGDTISFVATHLDHLRDSPDRILQVKEINRVFGSNKYPTLLAGDLNDVPGSKAISILEDVWTSSYSKDNIQPTHPSDNPAKKIDYVMFRQAASWKVVSTKVICDTIASDHCAYLVTLELTNR